MSRSPYEQLKELKELMLRRTSEEPLRSSTALWILWPPTALGQTR